VLKVSQGEKDRKKMPSAVTTAASTHSGGGSSTQHAPTVRDIISDQLTQISLEYWATGSEKKKPFSADLIEEIYKSDLQSKQNNKVMLLELSNYLEKYPFLLSSLLLCSCCVCVCVCCLDDHHRCDLLLNQSHLFSLTFSRFYLSLA